MVYTQTPQRVCLGVNLGQEILAPVAQFLYMQMGSGQGPTCEAHLKLNELIPAGRLEQH